MNKQEKYKISKMYTQINKLNSKYNNLMQTYLSEKKLRKATFNFNFWTLVSPLILITSSFIIRLLIPCLITHIILISSLLITFVAYIIDLKIAIDGGYKEILSKKIDHTYDKIIKIKKELEKSKINLNKKSNTSSNDLSTQKNSNKEIIISSEKESIQNAINNSQQFLNIKDDYPQNTSYQKQNSKKLVRKLTTPKKNNHY